MSRTGISSPKKQVGMGKSGVEKGGIRSVEQKKEVGMMERGKDEKGWNGETRMG